MENKEVYSLSEVLKIVTLSEGLDLDGGAILFEATAHVDGESITHEDAANYLKMLEHGPVYSFQHIKNNGFKFQG